MPYWLIDEVLAGHLTERGKLALLRFWGRYPYGWFDRRAISPFNLASRQELEEALDELLEAGILRCTVQDSQRCYSLSDDPRVRAAAMALARLTPNEVRYLAHQEARHPEAGSATAAPGRPRTPGSRDGSGL